MGHIALPFKYVIGDDPVNSNPHHLQNINEAAVVLLLRTELLII
jgi:hypothetical protein